MTGYLDPTDLIGEEGTGTGLSVTVDTFDNGGGEAPGLEIKWRGARVAFDNIDPDPGLAKDFLRKNQFVEADVKVDTAGNATFTYDGRVLTATFAGWTGIAGGNFVFGARTGGASDNHWIDDVLIETQVPANRCPTANPLSVSVDQGSQVNFQLLGADPDGDAIQYKISQAPAHGVVTFQPQTGAASYTPTPGSCGPDSFKYTVNDGQCVSPEAIVSITVNDTTPPAIANVSVDPSTLWPPDHTMRDVTLNYTAADDCGGPVTCGLTVESNEPDNGTGAGDTAPDWEVVDSHHLRLRAERSGTGPGRIYTITITCSDEVGNLSSHSADVVVPHSISAPKKH
jgi:hypothetical protein